MKAQSILLLFLIFLFSGCTLNTPTAALPTLQPTAALPTLAAVAAEPAPTVTITTTTSITTTVTAPTHTPTIPPTTTPIINPSIDIGTPQINATYQVGQSLRVSGRGIAYPNHTIEVAVLSLDRQLLTAAVTTLNSLNNWQTDLTLPTHISGRATVTANLFSETGDLLASDEVPLYLTVSTAEERYLLLQRPFGPTTAVAGYNLFFDGVTEKPSNYLLKIDIRNGPHCQDIITTQSYPLRGSGYWQAYVIIPETAAGAACAIAYFGDKDAPERREVQMPLNILARNDPNAYAIFLAFPPSDSNAVGGKGIALYGTAYNAPNNELNLTLSLHDGTIAASNVVPVDKLGYWEYNLLLPAGVLGETKLTLSLGRNDEIYTEQTIFLNLVEE